MPGVGGGGVAEEERAEPHTRVGVGTVVGLGRLGGQGVRGGDEGEVWGGEEGEEGKVWSGLIDKGLAAFKAGSELVSSSSGQQAEVANPRPQTLGPKP